MVAGAGSAAAVQYQHGAVCAVAPASVKAEAAGEGMELVAYQAADTAVVHETPVCLASLPSGRQKAGEEAVYQAVDTAAARTASAPVTAPFHLTPVGASWALRPRVSYALAGLCV